MRRLVLALCVIAMILVSSILYAAPVEIRYIYWGSTEELQFREDMIKIFEQKHPDIKVIREGNPPAEYDRKLTAQLTAGNAADVINMCNDWWGQRGRQGAFTDLTPFVKRDKLNLAKLFWTFPIKSMQSPGILEGLPYILKTQALFYNKRLFDEAGLAYPNDNWTWDNFLEAAIKLTKGEGPQKQYGVVGFPTINAAWMYGGEITSSNMKIVVANNPKTLKGIQFLRDLIFKYKVMPTQAEFQAMGTGVRFSTGRGGMMIDYSWSVAWLQQAMKDPWDVVQLPMDPATRKRYPECRADGLAIYSQSKNKDAAWELVKAFATDPDIQRYIAKNEGIPALKSVALSPEHLNTFKEGFRPYNKKAFVDAVSYAKLQPFGGYYNELGTAWTREMDLVLLGKQSPEEALAKFQKVGNEILKRLTK